MEQKDNKPTENIRTYESTDYVNHPSHYNKGGIECISGIIASRGIFRTIAFCQGNAIKYLWRQGEKDAEGQEIEKVEWYLNYEKNILKMISDKGGSEAVALYKRICAACNELDKLVKI